MKYLNQSFTLPVCTQPISDLEYALRVGLITQEEFNTQSGASTSNGLEQVDAN